MKRIFIFLLLLAGLLCVSCTAKNKTEETPLLTETSETAPVEEQVPPEEQISPEEQVSPEEEVPSEEQVPSLEWVEKEDGTYECLDPATGIRTPMPFTNADYSWISPLYDAFDGRLTGVSCWSDTESKMAFFNLSQMNFTIEIQGAYGSLSSQTYRGRCVVSYDENQRIRSDIVDCATGETLHSFDGFIDPVVSGDVLIYCCRKEGWLSGFSVYNADFQQISEEGTWYDDAEITADGNILLIEERQYVAETDSYQTPMQFQVIDPNGTLLRTSREFERVLSAEGEYVYVIADGRLCLYDSKDNLLVTFADCDSADEQLQFHPMVSGFFEEKPYQMDDYYLGFYKNVGTVEEPVYEKVEELDVYPAGLYFLTENFNESLGMEGTGLEFYYHPETGASGALAVAYIGGYAKPLLYLYPTEETDVTVSFAHPERLTVVYPDYPEDGWSVTASPDGTLTGENGRTYYALYWEESGAVPMDWSTGFCVPRDDVTEFLEEKLAILGLTEREANEFILYWLPVLQKKEYSLIQFELTESREAWNRLCITPAPDSLLRIAMHVRAADAPAELREQELPAFKREGFTAVEWGGVYTRESSSGRVLS